MILFMSKALVEGYSLLYVRSHVKPESHCFSFGLLLHGTTFALRIGNCRMGDKLWVH
jgi:hypothetical protein